MKQIDLILPGVGLYSDNAQKTPKRGKNNSHATRLVGSFFVIITFDVICALLEYKNTAKWNLFVKLTILWNENGRSYQVTNIFKKKN